MADDPIKEALTRMPYGFYALTSRHGDDVNAMVVNWVTQASFTPRLIAVGLQKTCYSHGLVEKGRVFAINLFLQADADAIKPYTKGRARKPDKMANARYTAAPVTGCPILEGAAAYVECKVVSILDVGGDHNIVVGEVVGGGVSKPGEVQETLTLPNLGWSYAG